MKTLKIIDAIKALRPDEGFAYDGDAPEWDVDPVTNNTILSNVTFSDPEVEKITKEEFDTFMETFEWVDPSPKEYQHNRMNEYPPLAEFVDAYYHEKNGDTSLMASYWEKVEAVKAKYPKE